MANEIFQELTKAILKHGEKEASGDNRVVTMSELSLIASVTDGKAQPLAIVFPLFGVDFIMLPEGTIALSNPDEEDGDSYLDLQDEETLKRIESFLRWRVEAIEAINI